MDGCYGQKQVNFSLSSTKILSHTGFEKKLQFPLLPNAVEKIGMHQSTTGNQNLPVCMGSTGQTKILRLCVQMHMCNACLISANISGTEAKYALSQAIFPFTLPYSWYQKASEGLVDNYIDRDAMSTIWP